MSARPTRRDLDHACDCVEQVLRERRAPASAVGGNVLPTFVELLLRPSPGTRVSTVRRLREDIGLALGAHNVRVAQRDHFIAVQYDLPAHLRQRVSLDGLIRRIGQQPPFTAVLGVSEEGSPLLARLSGAAAAHILVAGATGSGKTMLAQSIVLSLAALNPPRELGLVVVDPKRGPSRDAFAERIGRHVLLSARTPDEAVLALKRVVEVMRAREARPSAPRVLVYVDEAATVCDIGGAPVVDALKEIAQYGRELGVHALICTQKPTAAALDSIVKANLPMRLIGGVTSARDAATASGLPDTGAELLAGAGAFLCVAGGRVVRFQAAYPE